MRFQFIAAFVAGLGLFQGGAAFAQTQQQPGPERWSCEFGARSTQGPYANAIQTRFQMVISPDGSAQGQGVESDGTGSVPFQFQGAWGIEGQYFVIRGQKTGGTGGSLGLSNQQFYFASQPVSQTEMRLQHVENGMAIVTTCQRQN